MTSDFGHILCSEEKKVKSFIQSYYLNVTIVRNFKKNISIFIFTYTD